MSRKRKTFKNKEIFILLYDYRIVIIRIPCYNMRVARHPNGKEWSTMGQRKKQEKTPSKNQSFVSDLRASGFSEKEIADICEVMQIVGVMKPFLQKEEEEVPARSRRVKRVYVEGW